MARKRSRTTRQPVALAGTATLKTASRPTRVRQTTARRSNALAADPDPSAWQLSDDAAERALLTNEHASELDILFGEQGRDELARLARQAASTRRRGGNRVLILPGIMGSKLGVTKHFIIDYDDLLWLDPIDFAMGAAKRLAVAANGSPGEIKPMGVFLSAYLKLKFSLQIAGYNAEFYPFDWRLNLRVLGQQLKDHIRSLNQDVWLVAHSMGGLVARTAIKQGAKFEKLIMLGTPNSGSFAPVEAMRGVYSTVKKLAALDMTSTPQKLAEIFATFPGLCQMLPAPALFPAINFFDPKVWPSTGPKIQPKVLQNTADSQSLLAPGDERFYMIAGHNQPTVVGASLTADKTEFVYSMSSEGDGTVPLAFAGLEGIKQTYYVEESHGSLPNNGSVIQAVKDILASGATQALPTTHAVTRSAPVLVSESALRTSPFEGQPRGQLRVPQQREILSAVAAPLTPTQVSSLPDLPPMSVPTTVQNELFKGLNVSRVSQHRLEIHLAEGSITDIDARAYVLGLFREVTPSGASQAINKLMGGAITEFTQRRMFGGNVGEIFVAPTGRGKLRADFVVFAGLGAFDSYTDEVQQIVGENVMRTLLRTNVEEFATVMLGGASGSPMGKTLQNLLEGFLRAIVDADTDRRFRRITFCELDPQKYQELRSEVFRLASTSLFNNVEVSFTELGRIAAAPEPVFEQPTASDRIVRPKGKEPIYLMVRAEAQDAKSLTIRTSVLPPSSKAAILSDVKRVSKDALANYLQQINVQAKFTFPFLPKFGEQLAELVLPDSIRTILPSYIAHHLVVVHDRETARLPWEALNLTNGVQPALNGGMSHRYLAENMSVVKYLEARRESKTLEILLIVDPTETLAGALTERKRMLDFQKKKSGIKIDVIEGRSQGTRPAIMKAISSGKYDVLHYAGHAQFDPQNSSQSGLLCANSEVLSGVDLSGLSRLPSLVFFNACESARLRKSSTVEKVKQDVVHFAEAFLRGGVANFVGTYWPVMDAAAENVQEVFYEEILSGNCLGDALLEARKAIFKKEELDWANYIHYGDYQFQMKTGGK